jgi:hypothetical protein
MDILLKVSLHLRAYGIFYGQLLYLGLHFLGGFL